MATNPRHLLPLLILAVCLSSVSVFAADKKMLPLSPGCLEPDKWRDIFDFSSTTKMPDRSKLMLMGTPVHPDWLLPILQAHGLDCAYPGNVKDLPMRESSMEIWVLDAALSGNLGLPYVGYNGKGKVALILLEDARYLVYRLGRDKTAFRFGVTVRMMAQVLLADGKADLNLFVKRLGGKACLEVSSARLQVIGLSSAGGTGGIPFDFDLKTTSLSRLQLEFSDLAEKVYTTAYAADANTTTGFCPQIIATENASDAQWLSLPSLPGQSK